jgi:hypothetical protein
MKTPNTKRKGSRGIALVTTLLLLSLFTVMTLGMVIATTSDTLIDGYYNNFRASFYAADSGMNAARQYLINQFTAQGLTAGWTPTAGGDPVSLTAAPTIMAGLTNASTGLGSFNSLTGSQTASWPGKFKIDPSTSKTFFNTAGVTCTMGPTQTLSSGSHTTAPTTCSASFSPGYFVPYYTYQYPYQITAWGEAHNSEQNQIVENGVIQVTVNVTTSSTTSQSFAAWGMFIDQYAICDGSTLVPGTISGPVATNGTWNFSTSGSYIFTDPVSVHNANLGYQFGSCYQSPNQSYSSGGQTIAPQFKGGVSLGQPTIPLPANDFNQQEAVLDGLGNGSLTWTTSTQNTVFNANLMKAGDTAWPASSTPSSGVYVPYTATTVGGVTTRTMHGGGLYVQGNAAVTLTAGTSGADKTQVVTIVQGSGGSAVTTTVTYDLTAGTTTMAQQIGSGSTTTYPTITGLPDNLSASPVTEAALVYVNGTVTSLSGPSSGAAIQDGSALSLVGSGDINVTGNLLYKTEPVTTSGSNPDQLVSGGNTGQVFGIFTDGGNVNLNLSSSGQNLEIDASIATIKQGGSGGIVNTNQAINNLTIVGGRIQNTIQNIGATTRNVWFDRRFATGGFAPPWFPSTTVTTTGGDNYSMAVPTASRVSWVNVTAE